MLKYLTKKGASCPNRPLPCEKDRYKDSDGDNVQILSGALVAGPDESENFIGKWYCFKFRVYLKCKLIRRPWIKCTLSDILRYVQNIKSSELHLNEE